LTWCYRPDIVAHLGVPDQPGKGGSGRQVNHGTSCFALPRPVFREPFIFLFNKKEKIMKKMLIAVMLVFLWVAAAAAAVNINTAGQRELEALPGIGPAKAEAILKYRGENGPFLRVDDLAKVNGIGQKTLDSIRELIEVEKK
jgi:competence protein ComEA